MNPYNVLPLFRQGVFHGKNANIHLFCVGRRYISMTKDMTQGSPLKLLLAFAVPLMLGSLFQQFYNLADTIIVGRFVGVEALAAVGSVGGLNYLVLGFVNGIACGFSIPISWTFGAHDHHEMRRYTANTVWLSIAFATVLTVVTVAMTRLVLVWTNTPADIIDLADIYIRTIFAGIPFTLLYNVTSALMRALGDSKRPLYFLLVASVLNIGLDLACIILFNMGVFGAAFATVFSQAVAGIGSLIYIMRHYPELRWNKEEGRISAPHCAKLCAMGLPMGLQCSITAIGSVVLQGAVNGLGSDIVAAQTAGGKAAQFLSVPLESIGTAMTTYTSQNMGAKDLGRVNRGVNTALGIGCVYSVASFLILRVLDKPLIGLFLDAGETAITECKCAVICIKYSIGLKTAFWSEVAIRVVGVGAVGLVGIIIYCTLESGATIEHDISSCYVCCNKFVTNIDSSER